MNLEEKEGEYLSDPEAKSDIIKICLNKEYTSELQLPWQNPEHNNSLKLKYFSISDYRNIRH